MYFCRFKLILKINWEDPSGNSLQLLLSFIYCQNPKSTNNSIELNLRLDYILTQRSTTQHDHTNSLLLLLTAQASQAGKLYSSTVTASQTGRLYNCSVTHRPVQPLRRSTKFAHRANITVRISHLAVEGKGGRLKSIVTLRGADISHQHTQKGQICAPHENTVQLVCVKKCFCFVYGQAAQECVLCSPVVFAYLMWFWNGAHF
jgi:hypothetical protein